MSHHDEIIIQERNNLGILTLNRPKALNALNYAMIKTLTKQLKVWADDNSIKAVLVKGAGDKAFCAGGDVRAMYHAKQQGEHDFLIQFYEDEYNLNYLINTFPKPYISFLNGITMGGGAGVSINGKYRLATEKLIFAMPETNIGFFPDVGGTHFLSRCPDAMGLYLGLTGDKIDAKDSYALGLVTHYTSSSSLPALEETLIETQWGDDSFQQIDDILSEIHQDPGTHPLKNKEKIIEHCFGQKDINSIITTLKATDDSWAKNCADQLMQKSPTSLKVTHKQIILGKNLDLKKGLEMEYRLSQSFMNENEFFEGVRALLIDKDQKPIWQPSKLDDISAQQVDTYFNPKDAKELRFE
ncbi:MAG: enoyl-CoA hydratase/isomerase family protein [Alphaproteobacteria bacterium]|nr:enoyl-CoA hydratase/isomerase family protein [Alphaproteobacteria bacterium]